MSRLMIAAMLVAAPSTCLVQNTGGTATSTTLTATASDAGSACGPGTTQAGDQCISEDPLIGSWTGANTTCDFFPNHLWNQGCIGLDGWGVGWDRIGEDRYVLRSTYRNCWARSTFSSDGRSVHLDFDCAHSSFGIRTIGGVDLVRRDVF